MRVTFEDVKKNKAVQTYIRMADESLHAMGYTEHGFAHVERVAETAREILLTLGYSEREAELASIAGEPGRTCAVRCGHGVSDIGRYGCRSGGYSDDHNSNRQSR